MSPRVNNLQALRAIAAIMVLVHHVYDNGRVNGIEFTGSFINHWFRSGVDLFFVISGFVMVHIQGIKASKPVQFMTDRLMRICPLYWTLTVGLFAATLFAPSLFRNLSIDPHWLEASAAFVSGSSGYDTPILPPGWTLELEMFFYAVFATSLILRKLLVSVTYVSTVIISGVCLLGFNPIMIEFVMGMAIGLAYKNNWLNAYGHYGLVPGLVLWVLSANTPVEMDGIRWITYGIPCALIIIGACAVTQTNNRAWILLGDASYGIYLTQIFTIPLFFRLIPASCFFSFPLAIAASLAVGVAVHLLYEKPLNKMLKG